MLSVFLRCDCFFSPSEVIHCYSGGKSSHVAVVFRELVKDGQISGNFFIFWEVVWWADVIFKSNPLAVSVCPVTSFPGLSLYSPGLMLYITSG